MATVALVSVVALVAISFVVEALRPPPKTPDRLEWAQAIPIQYVTVNGGVKLRYIKAGAGPALVLLHTLRTQLDLFEKVVAPGEIFHSLCARLPRSWVLGYSEWPL